MSRWRGEHLHLAGDPLQGPGAAILEGEAGAVDEIP
jgi:hypothetical protein